MKIAKSITLDEDLWARIEKERGDVSRSKFVSNIIINHLQKKLKGGKIK